MLLTLIIISSWQQLTFKRHDVGGMNELVLLFVHLRRTGNSLRFLFSKKERKEGKICYNFIACMCKGKLAAQMLSVARTRSALQPPPSGLLLRFAEDSCVERCV